MESETNTALAEKTTGAKNSPENRFRVHRIALDTMLDMERDGFVFRDGGMLLVSPKERITDEQAGIIRDGRDFILEVLRWRRMDAATDEQVVRQSEAGLFDSPRRG